MKTTTTRGKQRTRNQEPRTSEIDLITRKVSHLTIDQVAKEIGRIARAFPRAQSESARQRYITRNRIYAEQLEKLLGLALEETYQLTAKGREYLRQHRERSAR